MVFLPWDSSFLNELNELQKLGQYSMVKVYICDHYEQLYHRSYDAHP